MKENYQEALVKTLARLQAEYSNLRIVLLAGSVARGEGGPTSDLDLYCLLDGDCRIRQTWIVDDVLVEIFLNPYQQILHYFSKEDPATMSMIMTGQIVYGDPADPILLRLREIAAKEWAAGPRTWSPMQQKLCRYMALDLYEDAVDVVDDRERSMWAGMKGLEGAVKFHYMLHGKWEVKPKHLLADLECWSPSVANGIRQYLQRGELLHLKAILDEIYAPVGGVERFDYSSGVDQKVPIAETEIVLLRHGWPSKDKLLRPDEWTLDYTAYLDLASYLAHPELQGLERMYTSPQVMAKQTAGFFFAQMALKEVVTVDGLNDVTGVNSDHLEEVKAFFAGVKAEDGREGLGDVQERIVALIRQLAATAREQRQHRIALVGHGLVFAALKQFIKPQSIEAIFADWEQLPYGPYAKIRVNAFGDLIWAGEILRQDEEETDCNDGL